MSRPPRRPTITFLLPALTMGGAEAQLLSVLERDPSALARYSVRVLIITSQRHPIIDARLAALGIPVDVIDRESLSFPGFLVTLVHHFRSSAPSAVHVFLAGSTSTWGRLAALLAGVRVIIYSDLSLNPTTTRAQRLLTPLLHRLTKRFLPNARAIANRLEREGASRERIVLLRNGVELGRFTPEGPDLRSTLGITPRARVVGFLGMLRPAKRPDLFFSSVLTLPEGQRPDLLLMAGDGALRSDVERQIAEDDWLRDHASLLGVVEDTPAFLRTLDLLVLTSDTEGLPNAVLEAMSVGVPCVATAVSDVPELLEGVGLVIPAGDARAIGDAIAKALSMSENSWTPRLEAGRSRIEHEYDMNIAAERFWRAHDELLLAGDAR